MSLETTRIEHNDKLDAHSNIMRSRCHEVFKLSTHTHTHSRIDTLHLHEMCKLVHSSLSCGIGSFCLSQAVKTMKYKDKRQEIFTIDFAPKTDYLKYRVTALVFGFVVVLLVGFSCKLLSVRCKSAKTYFKSFTSDNINQN